MKKEKEKEKEKEEKEKEKRKRREADDCCCPIGGLKRKLIKVFIINYLV
jgi:hypothetical protein